jgi:hypothetical protein
MTTTTTPSPDRRDHATHHGYTEGRVGGPGGAPVIAWFCHECLTGATDDATDDATKGATK